MKHPNPPEFITNLLRHFCKPQLIESILGDLQEIYQTRIERQGIWRAKLGYFIDAIGFLRSFARKKSQYSTIKSLRHVTKLL